MRLESHGEFVGLFTACVTVSCLRGVVSLLHKREEGQKWERNSRDQTLSSPKVSIESVRGTLLQLRSTLSITDKARREAEEQHPRSNDESAPPR